MINHVKHGYHIVVPAARVDQVIGKLLQRITGTSAFSLEAYIHGIVREQLHPNDGPKKVLSGLRRVGREMSRFCIPDQVLDIWSEIGLINETVFYDKVVSSVTDIQKADLAKTKRLVPNRRD